MLLEEQSKLEEILSPQKSVSKEKGPIIKEPESVIKEKGPIIEEPEDLPICGVKEKCETFVNLWRDELLVGDENSQVLYV